MSDETHLTQQEQISFLEEFIKRLNRSLDEITNGRDIPKAMKSLKLRIRVLEDADAKKYSERLAELKEELAGLEKLWAEKEPIINLLQDERSLYREVLNKI